MQLRAHHPSPPPPAAAPRLGLRGDEELEHAGLTVRHLYRGLGVGLGLGVGRGLGFGPAVGARRWQAQLRVQAPSPWAPRVHEVRPHSTLALSGLGQRVSLVGARGQG